MASSSGSVHNIEAISLVPVQPLEMNNLDDELPDLPPRPMRLHSKKSKSQLDVIMAVKDGLQDVLKGYERDGLIDKVDGNGYSALHLATRHNDLKLMDMLLKSGANVNLQCRSGFAPLHLAARLHCVDAAKLLLERNADVTLRSKQNLLPLHLACRQGNITMATLLLSKDTSNKTINAQALGCVTPLLLASKNGDRPLCEMLVRNDADITIVTTENQCPLYAAAADGHLEVVKFLLEEATRKLPNVKEYIDTPILEGFTPLYMTCLRGDHAIVHELLTRDSDPHAQTMFSEDSSLHFAATGGSVQVIEELLSHGALIEAVNMDRRTPLHKAATLNNTEAVKFLLHKGAKIDPIDVTRMTPFLLAVKKGRAEVAELLLEKEANIKAVDLDLRGCFHLAVMSKSVNTLQMLIKKDDGSLKEATETQIRTPLHYAAAAGETEMINLLMQHHCILNAQDENEMTPLHVAALNGEIEATEMLARALPKSVNSKDVYGRTPLHCAAEKGFKKTCTVLLNLNASIYFSDVNQRSPLHTAVQAGSLNVVKLLLDLKDSRLIGMLDKDENSALHLACEQKEVEIVKALLDADADVTITNKDGKTCLSVATDWASEDVATVLVQHSRWWEMLETKDKDGYGPMKRLLENLPNVAKIALDQCVSASSLPPNHPDYSITINVSFLDSGPDDGANLQGEPFEGPKTMVEYNREELLNHPVTQFLLRYKWFAYGKMPFIVNLIFFILLTVLFSYFIVSERDMMKMHYPSTTNATSEATRQLRDQSSSSFALAVVLTVFMSAELLKEIYQIILLGLDYLKTMSNYIDLTLLITGLIFVAPFIARQPLYISTSVQWNAGVVCVFLLYLDLLLFVRRVGAGGIYVSMYFEVWTTFIRVLGVFVIVIVGFSLVFYVLLKQEDNFTNVGLSFVKTSVMMVGELDYTDMLSDNVVNKKNNPSTGIPYVPLPSITYVVFVVFMIGVPVLLMNLLVGLAVGDIEAIKKSAEFTLVKDQVNYVVEAQRRYPLFLRRYLYKDKLILKPNVNKFLKSIALSGSTVTDLSFIDELTNVKLDTMSKQQDDQQTLQWEKQKAKLKELERKLEKQNKLMVAIADKLGITQTDEDDTAM